MVDSTPNKLANRILRGLMIGIEFQRPKGFALRTAWDMIHRMNDGLFPQAVTIPLLDDHGVLTQVAGHHMDVVKLIPPLVINEADVRWFLEFSLGDDIDMYELQAKSAAGKPLDQVEEILSPLVKLRAGA